ncbi:MAG: aminopeptidase P family protein [Deltaproteobacteria bacterium]|nr:aminopeptidase P family protein [Deltaproteobacteria bacterium]
MSKKAKLIIANSENCSDLYWATRFFVPDPIIFFEIGGKKRLIASDLEYGRAKKEASVDQVISYSQYQKKLRRNGANKIQELDILDALLKEERVREIEVPSYFPIRYAEALRQRKYRLRPLPDPFFPERQFKTKAEKNEIVKSLRATERAIQFAIETIQKTRVRSKKLYLGGTVLTSELLRKMMELKMMEEGYLGRHTIVACGRQAADPHCIGTGPLYANQSIVLDVFPKSTKSGFYGDISRTVIKGRASDRLKEMYHAVQSAQKKGISMIRHRIDGSKVHQAVQQTMESKGFRTGYRNGRPEGFIHSTGHGLGLDIHEPPRISRLPEILKKGTVVTVEPGLYYEKIGGIRIEDVVYVTEKGCEVLTKLPRQFEV